jgi:multidrug efflux system membrane fusion protein
MNDTNGLKPARTKEVARRLRCVLPGGYNTGIKIMSLQKTWGNFHLTRWARCCSPCSSDAITASRKTPRPAPAVSAADVVVKSISQWDSFNGRIEAVESVQLPRVSGYIDKVNYTDGQEVKKGEVLFTIDDRTYRAALEQAQANAGESQNAGQPGAKRG